MDELDIFSAALELETPEERDKYLDEACVGNPSLRERIEALLQSSAKASRFMESPPIAIAGGELTIDQPFTEKAGTHIDPYKLLQQIGEGGFGIVYMADQTDPVKRHVALKIIEPGMDTRQVIARFEAERQALAMMDHPNIAKDLDAGTTDSDRPYFVMELVRGVPITDYCDQHHLTPRERLGLFVPVCQAVQHAHQKGIIHRDIKPTNVLVGEYDDRAVPRIIDFGVAKATEQRLTEKTMFTQFGQVVGTVDYMSPEQARLNELDIDTRSDIYSLGVLLYELLTGETPFDRQRLRSAAFDELLRIIREEEPPKPSTRISTLGEEVTKISELRKTNPGGLQQAVRGDLDWLVMKALEKERARRYQTANSLAADVERYLDGDPIEARPPSTGYRLKKFAQRHRAPITTAVVITLCLFLATTTSTWLAIRNYQQAVRNHELLRELRSEIVAAALNAAFRGSDYETAEAMVRAKAADVPGDLQQTLQGVALLNAGDSAQAIQVLERAAQENPDSIKAKGALFWAYWQSGVYAGTDRIREQLGAQSWSNDDYDNVFLAIVRQRAGSPAQLQSTNRQLDQLIARHPLWGIAYSLRSSNLGELGLYSKNMAHFDQAVDDLERAVRLIPKTRPLNPRGSVS